VVIHVTEKDRGVGTNRREDAFLTDALITNSKDTILFMTTADCFPASFYDPKKEVIALVHLGWKPTELLLAKKVVERMRDSYGSDPKDLLVALGPGIHKESYIRRNPSQKDKPAWKEYVQLVEDNLYSIDLIGFNINELTSAGVQKENIEIDPHDTAVSPEYFSHQRAMQMGEKEGRMTTILGMK